MTIHDIEDRRLVRDLDGVSADVLVSGTRLHAWNGSRHGALNHQQVENKVVRMATAALRNAGANRDERWVVTIAGDDVSGRVSAERLG